MDVYVFCERLAQTVVRLCYIKQGQLHSLQKNARAHFIGPPLPHIKIA